MNNTKAKKGSFGTIDRDAVNKARIEGRNVENYTVDEKRKAIGHDDSWMRTHLAGVPANLRARAYQAFRGELSPLKAIRAMCEHCVGYANVREEISGCRGSRCPLYAYRPYQNDDGTESEQDDSTQSAE